jgi:transposase
MSQQLYAGIDVAADELVLAVCDASEVFSAEQRFPNTAAGIARLRRHLLKLGELKLCLEPTSRYHLGVLKALGEIPQLSLSVVNPYAARSFARATLKRGKTDRVDAQVLARYGLHCAPHRYCPPRPVAVELRAITRRIEGLTRQRSAEKHRQHAAERGGDPRCVQQSIAQQIAQLTRQLEALQQAALKLVLKDEQLAECYQQLLDVKGIATRSALALLGELSVLPDGMGKAQWVALAGLDPKPQESGSSLHAPRHISRQGNPLLRCALYMPALVMSQRSGPGRAYYRDLLARGKRPLQAIVALMRKLLLAIWGMFESHTTFDPTRFYHRSA